MKLEEHYSWVPGDDLTRAEIRAALEALDAPEDEVLVRSTCDRLVQCIRRLFALLGAGMPAINSLCPSASALAGLQQLAMTDRESSTSRSRSAMGGALSDAAHLIYATFLAAQTAPGREQAPEEWLSLFLLIAKLWSCSPGAKKPRLVKAAQEQCAILIRRARERPTEHRSFLAHFPTIASLDDHALEQISDWATSLRATECKRLGISTEIPYAVTRLVAFVRNVVLLGISLPGPSGGTSGTGGSASASADEDETSDPKVVVDAEGFTEGGLNDTGHISVVVPDAGRPAVDRDAMARQCVTWKDDFATTTILRSRGDLCDADARRVWRSLVNLHDVDSEASIAGRLSLNLNLSVEIACLLLTTSRGTVPDEKGLRGSVGYLDLALGELIRPVPVPPDRFMPTGDEDVALADVGDYIAVPIEDRLLADARRHFQGADLCRLIAGDPKAVEARVAAHFRNIKAQHVSMASPARWRDTFFKLVLRAGGRTLEGMMLAGQAFGHVASGRYYFTARAKRLWDLAYEAISRVTGSPAASRRAFPTIRPNLLKDFVGSRLHLSDPEARRLVSDLRARVGSIAPTCRSVDEIRAFHNRYIPWCAQLCVGVSGHRMETKLGEVRLRHFDCRNGYAFIQDKGSPRVVILNRLQVKQLSALHRHLVKAADLLRNAAPRAAEALLSAASGDGPLFFVLDADREPRGLNERRLTEALSLTLPANWCRHRLYSVLMAAGVSMTFLDAIFGHVEAGFHALGASSTASLADVHGAVIQVLDELIARDGWSVIRGLGPLEGDFWNDRTIQPVDNASTRILNDRLAKLTAARAPEAVKRKQARREHRKSAVAHVHQVATKVLTADVIASTGITIAADLGSALTKAVLADSKGPEREARLLALRTFLVERIKKQAWHVHLPNLHLPVEVEPPPFFEEMCRARTEFLAWRDLFSTELNAADTDPNRSVRRWLGITLLGAVLLNHITRRQELRQLLVQLKEAKAFPAPSALTAIAILPGTPEPAGKPEPLEGFPGPQSGALFVAGVTALSIARLQRHSMINQQLLDECAKDLDQLITSVVPLHLRKGRNAPEVVDYLLALARSNMRYETPGIVTAIWDGRLLHGGFSIEQWHHLLSAEPVPYVRRLIDAEVPIPNFPSLRHLRGEAKVLDTQAKKLYLELVGLFHVTEGRPKVLNYLKETIEAEDFRARLLPGLEREVLVFLKSKKTGLAPVVLALAAWAIELLRIGTPREPKLVVGTIHNKLTMVGTRLIEAIPTVDILSASPEIVSVVYVGLTQVGDKKKARLTSEISAFHSALVRAFGVDPVALEDVSEDAEPEVVRAYAVSPRLINEICRLLAEDPSAPERVRNVGEQHATLLARTGARVLETVLRRHGDLSFAEAMLRIVPTEYWGVKSHNSLRLIELHLTATERADGQAWLAAEREAARGDCTQGLVFAERPGLNAVIDPQLICDRLRTAIRVVTGDSRGNLRSFRHTSISVHVLACCPTADYLWDKGIRLRDLLESDERRSSATFRHAFAGDGAVGRGGIAQVGAVHGNRGSRSLVSYTHVAFLLRALASSSLNGDASLANASNTGESNVRKLRHTLRKEGVTEENLPSRACTRLYAGSPLAPLCAVGEVTALGALPPTTLGEQRLDGLRMIHDLLIDADAGIPVANLGRLYALPEQSVHAILDRARALAARIPFAGYLNGGSGETASTQRASRSDYQAFDILATADAPFDQWPPELKVALTCLSYAFREHFDVEHQCVATDDIKVVKEVMAALAVLGLNREMIGIECYSYIGSAELSDKELKTLQKKEGAAIASKLGVAADQVTFTPRRRRPVGALARVLELQFGQGQALRGNGVWRHVFLYSILQRSP